MISLVVAEWRIGPCRFNYPHQESTEILLIWQGKKRVSEVIWVGNHNQYCEWCTPFADGGDQRAVVLEIQPRSVGLALNDHPAYSRLSDIIGKNNNLMLRDRPRPEFWFDNVTHRNIKKESKFDELSLDGYSQTGGFVRNLFLAVQLFFLYFE